MRTRTTRSALPLALVFLTPSLGLAQDGRIELGVRGGLNRTTMTGVGPIGGRIEGQAGLFARFPVSSALAFRPEIGIAVKQSEWEFENALVCPAEALCTQPTPVSASTVERTTFTWLEVPLLLEATLPELAGGVTPYLAAGPFLAVRPGRVRCSTGFGSDTQPLAESTGLLARCDDQYGEEGPSRANNGDAGFVLGGGVRIGGVGASLRWTRSLVAAVPFTPFGFSRLMGGKQSMVSLTIELAKRM